MYVRQKFIITFSYELLVLVYLCEMIKSYIQSLNSTFGPMHNFSLSYFFQMFPVTEA